MKNKRISKSRKRSHQRNTNDSKRNIKFDDIYSLNQKSINYDNLIRMNHQDQFFDLHQESISQASDSFKSPALNKSSFYTNNYESRSNPNSKTDHMKKLFKLIKNCAKLMEKERMRIKHDERMFTEWKEVARRFDIFLFVISIAIVHITPIYLFGKFFILSSKQGPTNSCGCTHN